MPPLKETRLQIQERTAREIRNRTAARIAQLRTESVAKQCQKTLKETKLQIQERTAREIRNRTAAILAQLRTECAAKQLQTKQVSDEEDVVDDRSVDKSSLCIVSFSSFIFVFCLKHIYHAKNQTNLRL
jgi:hypothetical protein